VHPRASLRNLIACLALPVALMLAPPALAKSKVDKGVTYTVTFTAAWTKQIHPNPAFPNHPLEGR
jgi:hypothetical protein